MRTDLGLRLRFALFFAALAFGGCAVIIGGLWLGFSRSDGGIDGYVLAGLVAGFGLLGLCAWIGLLFDENVARPILALASDLHTRANTDVEVDIDLQPARYLGALAPSAQAIHAALEEAREGQERAVAEKTARVARDKALLETLIRDLNEAVIVLSADNRIMLYNSAASELIGDLGLDRRVSRFLFPEPLQNAIERTKADNPSPASFLTTTISETALISGTVTPVQSGKGNLGYVLLFRDATEELRAQEQLDAMLKELIEATRRPAMAIGAILDVLAAGDTLSKDETQRLTDAIRSEIDHLSTAAETCAKTRKAHSTNHWPMQTVPASMLFAPLLYRHGETLTLSGGEIRLHCDCFALAAVLDRIITSLLDRKEREQLELKAIPDGDSAALMLNWSGPGMNQGRLDALLNDTLAPAYGTHNARDALKAHRTDVWIENGTSIILPLPRPGAIASSNTPSINSDFYDFTLPEHVTVDSPIAARTLVVFDTETTGLNTETDAIVQIAAVRIVNGRILEAERFDSLVNPGRRIPAVSTSIHGITDEMVSGAPDIQSVAEKFAEFADGAVLVAHNAPFDMAFLKRAEMVSNARFDQPVLCTARLSLGLHDHTGDHTLDALAERYGIRIAEQDRHTAIGDAAATGAVFLKMVSLFAMKDIVNLSQFLAFQNRVASNERG